MVQAHETHSNRAEEEPVDEDTARNVGNQALKDASEKADDTIDLIDELLQDPDFSEDQAQETIKGYVQKGGQ